MPLEVRKFLSLEILMKQIETSTEGIMVQRTPLANNRHQYNRQIRQYKYGNVPTSMMIKK
jgi:hypothetical protein